MRLSAARAAGFSRPSLASHAAGSRGCSRPTAALAVGLRRGAARYRALAEVWVDLQHKSAHRAAAATKRPLARACYRALNAPWAPLHT